VFGCRSGSPVSDIVFTRVPKKTGIDAGAPHSCRSIWRDWAGDIDRVDRDLAEAALAHTDASCRREAAIEARLPVMDAYATWLCGDAGADISRLRVSRVRYSAKRRPRGEDGVPEPRKAM
jgi:hypothetical protein